MLLRLVLESLYFLAPAGFAILTPALLGYFKLIETLNIPVDLGKTFRGKRILGDHKTVRGFVIGTLTGALVGFIQYLLSRINFFQSYSLVNYSNLYLALTLGTLLGFGGLVGDSIKSFFKRQANISPGKSWFPFDQIDYILGAYVFAMPIIVLETKYLVALLVIYTLIHLTSHIVGYVAGVNKEWI